MWASKAGEKSEWKIIIGLLKVVRGTLGVNKYRKISIAEESKLEKLNYVALPSTP